LQNLCKSGKFEANVLISPLNIYTALALTHLGAAGITRTELEKQIFGITRTANENEYVLINIYCRAGARNSR